jgi:DNA-binding MarR family transcriptional regulator
MKKEVLSELIDLLYEFDSNYEGVINYNLSDFLGFLNSKVDKDNISMRKIEGNEQSHIESIRQESESDTTILITLMFRYAKGYIKKALLDSQIQTADEFAFLITLMTHQSLTKTELINKQIMEKTSGIEVIKRLIGQNMISEFADEEDKRSVRVAITQKGKNELIKVLPEMAKVSKIVVGNLSKTEILTLSYLLKKLDFFHNEIFMNKKSLNLNQLLQSDH